MNKRIIKLSILVIGFIIILFFIRYFTYDISNPNSGNFDNNKDFVDNQVYIVFNKELSSFRFKIFLMQIQGKNDVTTQDIMAIGRYGITLNKTFETKDEIEEYCKKLIKKHNIIEYCYPIKIHDSINLLQ